MSAVRTLNVQPNNLSQICCINLALNARKHNACISHLFVVPGCFFVAAAPQHPAVHLAKGQYARSCEVLALLSLNCHNPCDWR